MINLLTSEFTVHLTIGKKLLNGCKPSKPYWQIVQGRLLDCRCAGWDGILYLYYIILYRASVSWTSVSEYLRYKQRERGLRSNPISYYCSYHMRDRHSRSHHRKRRRTFPTFSSKSQPVNFSHSSPFSLANHISQTVILK